MMNEKNMLYGKMFLIFALLLSMPYAHAFNVLDSLGGIVGNVVNGIGDVVKDMTSPKTTLGQITLTTGVLAASYFGTELLQNRLAGGSPAAKDGAQWGNIFGQAGALIGAGAGTTADVNNKLGAPGIGALSGGIINFAATIIAGGIYTAVDKPIATLQRMIYVRVKTLDVNDAKIYEPKFKDHGSVLPTNKINSKILLDQNFVRKSNEKYNVYYPIELHPDGNKFELEHFVLGLDVKGLPETLGKTPLGRTLTDDMPVDQTLNRVEVLTLSEESDRSIGWCKAEDKAKLAEIDNEVSKEYVERSIEEAQISARESFVLLFRNLADENQIIDIPEYNCFGKNGLRGATGEQYKPKVEYNWAYNTDWIKKCDANNENYIYCDALQFNMALINLFSDNSLNTNLGKIGNITNTMDMEINDDTKKVYNRLNFKAYLMKDGYTKDFMNDFVDYALNTTFLSFNDSAKNIIRGLYEDNKIEFRPLSNIANSSEGYQLQSAGLYNVVVNISYTDEQGAKNIFISNRNEINPNIKKITVYLELVSDDKNPVYYMPLDATMGVKNGVIDRIGYGVDFKGSDSIWFKNEPNNPMFLEPTLRSNSTPIVSLNMSVISDVAALNGFNKGLLLEIGPRASSTGQIMYDVKRYLSYPAPVGLQLEHKTSGDAYAFYTINIANSPRTAGNSFIDWSLVCPNNSFNCRSFDGATTLDDMGRSDIYGVNAKAPIGQLQSLVYGLYWDKDSIEKDIDTVRYVGLVYLPEGTSGSMNIVTNSGDAKLYNNNKFDGPSKTITLNPEYRDSINDLEKIYELIGDGKVCVGYAEGSYDIKFWWNPAIFFPQITM